ncbi:hypothetical protein AB0D10_27210 [Kitasatospora sp. NPDC048545]|uniref:hypothetical protein n=1 Tax=Kitasatospora sp. NPDC048545 TaxID=3157208 RepID=UPI0033FB7DA8
MTVRGSRPGGYSPTWPPTTAPSTRSWPEASSTISKNAFARALIRTTVSRLCRPGGTFSFSDIATPNPYAALMAHIGRWNLVERTPADIEAGGGAAAPPGTVAGPDITADATGLTLFATVRRTDEPG